MAFGILELTSSSFPSGTSNIQDNIEKDESETRVIRVPQPSQSPLDPLNWSRIRKELLFATILLGSSVTGSIGLVLVPGFTVVAQELNVEVGNMTLLNGLLVLTLGVSAYICSTFADIFGKSLVYLFTILLVIAASCWAVASTSYDSLLGSRAIQGLGMGGFFALAGTASINDVFFVHERGTRVGLWNLGVITSVNLTPVISGYVISTLSWRWSFWLEAIINILLFPETTFDRAGPLPLELESGPLDDKTVQISMVSDTLTEPSGLRWRCLLGVEVVRMPGLKSFLNSIVAPFVLLPHPIVIYGSLMWAVTFTWTILLGAVVSQIFTRAPYNMNTIAVGNLSGIAPFIGSALGTVMAGWLCDFSATYLAKRNHGTYVPEFRLLVIFPAAIAMAIGSFGLRAAIHNSMSAIVCGVFMAMINFAVCLGCTGTVSYTSDACGENASDAFGIAMVIKIFLDTRIPYRKLSSEIFA
ncbi:uncharacterized protein N7484_000361 [Penicillium longicatenatum]|uniref:uncharacterized protein n=1 Tax=Penicillium longicatenatum TaxID=1561947 RepID=UPI00254974CF|nr:uncharacterized protein N7484_000361 [Penicillium longicatenatum]KAJ5660989.1 hypothetical protein N7484_000361 [Penicillium longicatenatum]